MLYFCNHGLLLRSLDPLNSHEYIITNGITSVYSTRAAAVETKDWNKIKKDQWLRQRQREVPVKTPTRHRLMKNFLNLCFQNITLDLMTVQKLCRSVIPPFENNSTFVKSTDKLAKNAKWENENCSCRWRYPKHILTVLYFSSVW